MRDAPETTPADASRRRFVQGVAVLGGVSAIGFAPRSTRAADAGQLRGTVFDLSIAETPINVTGRPRLATAVNGLVPGPGLRWREGDTVTLNVTNRLREPTSIHWHGIRSPAEMDGVPGLSFRGIMPGETFTYRLPIKQAGTYWYHSHSGMQEQTGLYGAIVIEPRRPDPHAYDREHVILLSDWTDEDPMTVVANLKQEGSFYNFHQRTVGDLAREVKRDGLTDTIKQRAMWARMRMSPTDLEDVSGATYTYLVNGAPPRADWTGLFTPGERVRLRIVNGSSMTIFDVRIPGLKMSVVQSDGCDVHPVEVDELRIGVAETYDVIVTPTQAQAYTVFAQSLGRSGYARATLAPRLGMSAAVPAMDPVPVRSMTDMGMAMGGMDMKGMDMGGGSTPGLAGQSGGSTGGMAMGSGEPPMRMAGMSPPPKPTSMSGESMGGMSKSGMGTGSGDMPMQTGGMTPPSKPVAGAVGSIGGMSMGGMAGMNAPASTPSAPMAGMGGSAPAQPAPIEVAPMTTVAETDPRNKLPVSDASQVAPADLKGAVDVDNVAAETKNRLGEAGDGLDGNGRRVLTYTDLKALEPSPDRRPPTREIVFHLTGNMQRWTWGFDGKKFSEAPPVHLALGERVRFILVNDTMMEHPIHLHGLFSEIENGQGEHSPLKHTVIVKPGERMSYLVGADTPGHWAFHCHLLYHMETGMMRTVIVS